MAGYDLERQRLIERIDQIGSDECCSGSGCWRLFCFYEDMDKLAMFIKLAIYFTSYWFILFLIMAIIPDHSTTDIFDETYPTELVAVYIFIAIFMLIISLITNHFFFKIGREFVCNREMSHAMALFWAIMWETITHLPFFLILRMTSSFWKTILICESISFAPVTLALIVLGLIFLVVNISHCCRN